MDYALPALVCFLALTSIFLAPKASSIDAFFSGKSNQGIAPGLLTLTLSQVTTWIFARSLMNAAILGFYYGIWGSLAYAAYYLSFVTGGLIIDNLRFKQGYGSVQAFLQDRFGKAGTWCYNFVIGLRLVSEVFANLLVIGILFGAAGSQSYTFAILVFASVTLLYSAWGGLNASLKTDVFQMSLFIAVLIMLVTMMITGERFEFSQLGFVAFDIESPGPILMAVAFLQVWSYPMHDPVMMDRGFLADRDTTRKSFMHAAWISIVCIIAFGSIGVFAGANAVSGQSMNEALLALLGDFPMLLFNAALVISAMSTLDSTLSSSAKLTIIDSNRFAASLKNGRIAMSVFMLAGLGLVFLGNKDLFSAVAVSGTASMYLAPVIFFSLWGMKKDIPVWSYLVSFVAAISGAILYFLESSGHTQMMGEIHKYTKLLYISGGVLIIGNLAFFVGMQMARSPEHVISEPVG